jgi:hypothetical protein
MMTTKGQKPVAEVAERPHLALRRAVVDVAVNLRRTGVLSHSGHANLSTRVGLNAIMLADCSQIRDLGLARYETLARLGQAEEVPVVPWVPWPGAGLSRRCR